MSSLKEKPGLLTGAHPWKHETAPKEAQNMRVPAWGVPSHRKKGGRKWRLKAGKERGNSQVLQASERNLKAGRKNSQPGAPADEVGGWQLGHLIFAR